MLFSFMIQKQSLNAMNIIGRLILFERMHDLMNVICSLNVIINVHSSNMRYMIHIRYELIRMYFAPASCVSLLVK